MRTNKPVLLEAGHSIKMLQEDPSSVGGVFLLPVNVLQVPVLVF